MSTFKPPASTYMGRRPGRQTASSGPALPGFLIAIGVAFVVVGAALFVGAVLFGEPADLLDPAWFAIGGIFSILIGQYLRHLASSRP